MRKPLFVFVGLRYLRARPGSGFASFVSAASVIGVALGVATLIVVLSVMNGFENELRGRLLGLTSHASVVADGGVSEWPRLVRDLGEQPGIVGAAPYIEFEAMLSGPGGLAGGLVTGVEPNLEVDVSAVGEAMLTGRLADLRPGEHGILLGRALASRLGVTVGDRVTVLVPRTAGGSGQIDSRLTGFAVTGIFELGVRDHDSVRALVHIDDADAAIDGDRTVTGVRLETTDIFSAPVVARTALAAVSPAPQLSVVDWTEQNASYFRAIRIEKTMMALLLSLIIGVAAFNIVATLVMVVTEKRSGIAILRTLGCSRRDVVAIFVLQGTLIGWIGALLGIGVGVWMALNVETLAPALEDMLGFQFMPADLYYLTALPSELRPGDVLWTSVAVLLITMLATVYPALRAAHVQPAEVLRYE